MVGQGQPFDIFLQELLYTMPIAGILRRHQRDRLAAVFRASRTADTMNIVLGIMGYVVVDDERYVGDVDAA